MQDRNLAMFSRGAFKKAGKDLFIDMESNIIGHQNIELGDNVRIDAGVKILCASGFLKIGSHVHIAAGTTLLCGGGIIIGDHCGISIDCKIISASEDFSGNHLLNPNVPKKYRNTYASPIVLEPFSMVCAASTMLPGSCLKRGAVLGAMSLVRGETFIPEYTFGWGVPVKDHGPRDRAVEKLAEEFEKEYNELSKTDAKY